MKATYFYYAVIFCFVHNVWYIWCVMAVVNKVVLGQVFLQVVWVCPGSLAS